MASEKNSRLVNLVIALLATKKFLTKPQIFNAVAGYEGTSEAADRMFERDKEELRALGIEIEMKSIDPFFEDEIGYRIRPERYRFDLGPLTQQEIGLMAIAVEAFKDTAFNDLARSTAIRLDSMGIAADFSDLPRLPARLDAPEILLDLLNAIENQKVISIQYRNEDDELGERHLAPYGIYSRSLNWYIYARDLGDQKCKSFRIDRIEGQIKSTRESFTPEKFELPKEHFPAISTELEIRRDYAGEILRGSQVIQEGDEWIRVQIDFDSELIAFREVLRNTPNIKVIKPKNLQKMVLDSLERLVERHEH